ncbi:DNA/RNA non-specific endonuclease [Georgenia daeguensis]|uniref:DNA/RNA non-specific endonuclease n=1 Tax=Georgenia daeguensis TaxID=908355 RepID=A0ABP8EW95_9MICO
MSTTAPGYDPAFLGVPVPVPSPAGESHVLGYTHFTVVLDPARRLAVVTAVNVDGAALREVPRGDDWRLDPRVPAEDQAGEELYAGNDLDRGHLVRRRDPVWGEAGVARRASSETFHYTNAAPQAAGFNQSRELWLGLEDHVLEHARAHRLRLSVLTAPVLADDDPVYRGVAIPQQFWKVVAWTTTEPRGVPGEEAPDGRSLAAAAFVLDQRPQLAEIDLSAARARAAREGRPPPLGPFRTFQVPVRDVEDLTGLDLGPLVAADRLPVGPAPAARRLELHDLHAIRL